MSAQNSQRDSSLRRSIVLGFIGGALLGIAIFVFEFIFPIWLPVMAPPEKAVELLAYHFNIRDDSNTLYVRTALGNIYAYGPSSYGAHDAKWRRVEQVNLEANGYECSYGELSTPTPPGNIVDQIESHPCFLDSASQINHVILEDGSMWKWEKTTGEFDFIWTPLGLIAYILIGGGLGVAAGIIISYAILNIKKQRI